MHVRPAAPSDEDSIWDIFHATVAAGDTYAYDPDTPRAEALMRWIGGDARAYVAVAECGVVGTSTLRPNQPGLGSHVANASVMVAPRARGGGVGRALGEHALEEARRLGFIAMQFNLVVATNGAAIALWESLGFHVAGRLPRAFNHRGVELVDALVMYREL